GNGGNLEIQAGFIVAPPSENNDMIANAFQGRGGNIRISTQNIFGLAYRDRLTPQSDITASSEFGVDGVVSINTPAIDPSQSLVALPNQVIDASRQIAQSCGARSTTVGDRFTVTGRGGLPQNPSETLNNNQAMTANWVTLSPEQEPQPLAVLPSPVATNPTPEPILIAQGWVIDPQGMVTLIAQPSTVTPQPPVLNTATCVSSR
ncbi:MAG: S-layer family protein, partial [Leptolyngbyaceae bacterium]|nr:S-layer family protein [Leptolyngbyaceae bacterium]